MPARRNPRGQGCQRRPKAKEVGAAQRPRGRTVQTGTKQELTSKGEIIECTVEGIHDTLLEKIREASTQVKVEGNRITVTPKDSKTMGVIPEIIINHGGKLLSLNSRIESLEDIFYRLIKEEENSGE